MDRPSYEQVVEFHGHSCPGLALGYRMTVAGLEALGVERACDEELVAVVENDACGVDAVQYLAGCTFGKGNLVFRDYGKPVYTFINRRTGQAVRVAGHRRGLPEGLGESRRARIEWLLGAPDEQVLSCQSVEVAPPPPAALHGSGLCDRCGERVMETRLRTVAGRRLCIPCAEAERSN
ncbi:MAG: FmdE family protein [Candidatus Bipolaricaulaceae bacterium]